MAIYQFNLTVLPRVGVLHVFGEIPAKLEVDFQKRTEEFLKGDWDDESDDYDLLIEKCWKVAKVNPEGIIRFLDENLNRAYWGNHIWKTESDNADIDASISLDENRTQLLEFGFRVSMSEPGIKFLRSMIGLAVHYNFLFLDTKGNLAEPVPEKVFELIKQSNAFRFVNDPVQYFSDLANGKIIIE